MGYVETRRSSEYYPSYPATPRTGDTSHTCGYPSIPPQLSVAMTMGTDPISKLAAAIEKLAEALRADGGSAF